MATIEQTADYIVAARTWDERVARIRQIPQRHGTNEHATIHADVAMLLYVPHLAPDYAYVPTLDFYELAHFQRAYDKLVAATAEFSEVTVDRLAAAIQAEPTILLPLRTMIGLLKKEFAWTTKLVAEPLNMKPLSENKIDSMERSGSATSAAQARIAAETIDQIMGGDLFGDPPGQFNRSRINPTPSRDGIPCATMQHTACPTRSSFTSATTEARSARYSTWLQNSEAI